GQGRHGEDFCRIWVQGGAVIEGARGVRSPQVLAGAVAAVLMATPLAAGACEGLAGGPRGVVAAVTDGDTVILDSGLVVRLIGMQAPKLPLGRAGFETWPLAAAAKAALEALVLGQPVELRYGGERVDRHGRALGHLFVSGGSGLWVQQRM